MDKIKTIIYHIYKVIRSIAVALLLFFAVLYSIAYLVLLIPPVQEKIKTTAERELSVLLDTKISIGKVTFSPFNEVTIHNVHLPDKEGRTLAEIDRIGAGINLYDLLSERRIVFDYAEIIGLEAHAVKADKKSPFNFQFIIDALKPKDKNKPPKKFDIELDVVVLRKCDISLDVLSEPHKASGFDANHIAISQLSADIKIPKLKNDTFDIVVKRLSANERGGFVLNDFTANLHITQDNAVASGIKIMLPNSILIPHYISLRYGSLKTMAKDLKKSPLSLQIANSYISLSDFQAFIPEFRNFTERLYLTCAIGGTLEDLRIGTLDISSENSDFTLRLSGTAKKALAKDSIRINLPAIKMYADSRKIAENIDKTNKKLPAGTYRMLDATGFVSLNGSFRYSSGNIFYAGNISTALGTLATNGNLLRTNRGNSFRFKGQLKSGDLSLGTIVRKEGLLDKLSFDIDADVTVAGTQPKGNINGRINHIDFKGYRYRDIIADVELDGKEYRGEIALHDPNADLSMNGAIKLDGEDSSIDIKLSASDINPNKLNLTDKYPAHSLSAEVEAEFTGNTIDNAEGDIIISDICYTDSCGKGIKIDHFDITSRSGNNGKYITVNSDLVNGYVDGKLYFANIGGTFKNLASVALPSLFQKEETQETKGNTDRMQNQFVYSFKFAENNELTSFFNLPVRIVHPITLSGEINEPKRTLSAGIDAPYIMQGNKIIERTSLSLNIDGESNSMDMNVITQLDHKNGDILFILNNRASDDNVYSDISWQYDRKKNYSGHIDLTSTFKKYPGNDQIHADINVNPTFFTVNDTIWNIAPSKITVEGKKITVKDIFVYRENQFIKADGQVSESYDDILNINLKSIDLGYIFETLNINHVAFGGIATGDFFASGALSPAPQLNTSNLNVKNFTYHNALLGEADIKSAWDNENKGIIINADIHQPNQHESFVRGTVYPTRDSLNFKFATDRINIQILKPFMAAFTSDVSGEASGECELYGTFKFLNVRGRMFAENFKMKVDYTNTYYTVSDSVILDPGLISIRNATVHDQFGHTAKVEGTVRHDYFKNARFNFSITDVDNMLCYDISEKMNPLWYGKVFANGSAFISGEPGSVDLDINMSTAPNSTFTFVLSEQEEAGEYSFITFTDKQKEKRQKEEDAKIPDFLKKQIDNNTQNKRSLFNLNLQIDANPDVAMTLLMGTAGSDKIRATGNGNLRIEYSSADEMRIFGNYTVEQGRYNFTLQDIILKEFTIRQGASVTFNGNPLNANINLQAAYSLNANLQDLDESFATDRELNRTLVPVNALLNLSGSISQPEITFDLEFPTLSQDVYRKVRSIVSTDDMMNQQIIYLLALSRFYTPEYMGNTGRNNELASVASSTISSQLSNMLGQLSDKLSIAPNFHTDKGDFSDMEVQLALSSRLLNNRLLLNGNFGYSDNAMNNNSFIGDFDIEYLLTKSGNFRLKAYNRYNDQNYYTRNSLTTQGVGIVFKHDFDKLFRRRKEKTIEAGDSVRTDSTGTSSRLPVRKR